MKNKPLKKKKGVKAEHSLVVRGCDSIVFPLDGYIGDKIEFAKKEMGQRAIQAVLKFSNEGKFDAGNQDAICARIWNERITVLKEVQEKLSVLRFNVVTQPEFKAKR